MRRGKDIQLKGASDKPDDWTMVTMNDGRRAQKFAFRISGRSAPRHRAGEEPDGTVLLWAETVDIQAARGAWIVQNRRVRSALRLYVATR